MVVKLEKTQRQRVNLADLTVRVVDDIYKKDNPQDGKIEVLDTLDGNIPWSLDIDGKIVEDISQLGLRGVIAQNISYFPVIVYVGPYNLSKEGVK